MTASMYSFPPHVVLVLLLTFMKSSWRHEPNLGHTTSSFIWYRWPLSRCFKIPSTLRFGILHDIQILPCLLLFSDIKSNHAPFGRSTCSQKFVIMNCKRVKVSWNPSLLTLLLCVDNRLRFLHPTLIPRYLWTAHFDPRQESARNEMGRRQCYIEWSLGNEYLTWREDRCWGIEYRLRLTGSSATNRGSG